MGSSRLPGKVLMAIGPKLLLDHVVERARFRPDVPVVVATGSEIRDDAIEARCRLLGVDCFRGDEQDVLGRYVACASSRRFDHVIRLTADNPFTDMDELHRLLAFHLEGKYDYSESVSALPVGAGAEIFSAACLHASEENGKERHHREHVNEYVLENSAIFRIGRPAVPAAKARSDIHLTIDTADDLRKACFVIQNAATDPVTLEEAIELCSRFA